jgi:hypothetical protein
MDIHFISTLTPEDEDRYAPKVLEAVKKAILDLLPISYAVRLTTANARVFQHARADEVPGSRLSMPLVAAAPNGTGMRQD